MKEKNTKKKLLSALKIIISLLFIIIVVNKIDFSEILYLYSNINHGFLVIGLLLFLFSQIISSVRLTIIFHNYDFKLSQKSNLKLYFIGMFYNYFIPGGIGGDAYKVYALNRKFGWKLKTLFQSVLLDRLVGLFAVLFLILLLVSKITFSNNIVLSLVSVLSAILLIVFGKFISCKLFQKFSKAQYLCFILSITIQILQSLAFLCFIFSLKADIDFTTYTLVFFVSSILSIVSFSGIGAREYVFYQSAVYFSIDAQVGVAAALAFNVITALISFIGVYYIINKPVYILSD